MNNVYLVTKCFITNSDGKILVLKRAVDARVRPGKWDLPGGMIEEEENPNTAILREIKEETAINCTSASIVYISTELSPAYILTFFYVSKYEDEVIMISDEHTEFNWISIQNLKKLELPEKFNVASMHLH